MARNSGLSIQGEQVYGVHREEQERSSEESAAIERRSKVGRAGPYEGWTMDVRERDAELLRALLKH